MNKEGVITQLIGAVVDVKFPDKITLFTRHVSTVIWVTVNIKAMFFTPSSELPGSDSDPGFFLEVGSISGITLNVGSGSGLILKVGSGTGSATLLCRDNCLWTLTSHSIIKFSFLPSLGCKQTYFSHFSKEIYILNRSKLKIQLNQIKKLHFSSKFTSSIGWLTTKSLC